MNRITQEAKKRQAVVKQAIKKEIYLHHIHFYTIKYMQRIENVFFM